MDLLIGIINYMKRLVEKRYKNIFLTMIMN